MKRIVALMLLLAMVLSLAACGAKKDTTSEGPNKTVNLCHRGCR